jgi:site-specific recombinase XerD
MEIDAGIAQPSNACRLACEEMRDALYADYKINGRKWLRTAKDGKTQYVTGILRLDEFFKGWRAMRISTTAIRKYIRARQEHDAENGTINRELALLRRIFSLAIQDKKLRFVPHFPMLKEAAPRKG